MLKQKVKVIVYVKGPSGEEKEVREYPVDDLKFHAKRRRDRGNSEEEREARELEMLEKKEGHRED